MLISKKKIIIFTLQKIINRRRQKYEKGFCFELNKI